jgi:tetratricopeptide (TPR) repeat protein
MIFDINYIIEKFILGKLKGKELLEFQTRLKKSPELTKKVKYNRELIESIGEKDVMELRSNLKEIISNRGHEEKHLFDLAKNISPGSVSALSPDGDIPSGENPLQHIHIENHIKSLSERIHIIDKNSKKQQPENMESVNETGLWDEIEQAVSESDVMELRNSIKQILATGNIDVTDFEIDSYLSGDMPLKDVENIEKLIKTNKAADKQVKLHREINKAISETDIHTLRAAITAIINENQQVDAVPLKQIDDYLLDYLNEKERLEFEAELSDNEKLRKETKFNNEINQSVTEKDILRLRASLKEITGENNEETKIRRLIPETRNKHLRYIGAAASITAIISASAYSLLKPNPTNEKLYEQAYKPYSSVGLYRSMSSSDNAFKGIEQYNLQNYESALKHFDLVISENNMHPVGNYYSGLCYLEMEQYNKAIQHFKKVIKENNNLFIEQAEWYMALGYLANKEEKKAYTTLYAIIEKKSYYKKNAEKLLKKLK